MVRILVALSVISLFFAHNAQADQKGKPVLAEMQNLFSIIKSLKKENSELKTQLNSAESEEVRMPAEAKPSKQDSKLVLINKKQYEAMVKEIARLKQINQEKEKMIVEMEEGL